MRGSTRLLLIGAGAVLVVLLFVVLRPGNDEDGDEDATPATTASTTTPPGTTTEATTSAATTRATTTADPGPEVTLLRITVRSGRPVGGIQRARVRKGERVRIVVRSDKPEHVHLHGYDVFRDVGPGRPAVFAFRPTLVGGFEIELEDVGLQIGELEVRP